jgi:hypothetical protein
MCAEAEAVAVDDPCRRVHGCTATAARTSYDDGMTDNGLPCLELLEATPGILRGLMSELTDDDARWKPAPDRISVAEVVAHLPLGGPLLPDAGRPVRGGDSADVRT